MNPSNEQIFLSYAREDFEIAKKLYSDFSESGLRVWWDYESLLPGENWKEVISREIKQPKYFLALLSNNSLNKQGYVQKELRIAYEILQESPINRVFVIPIRLEECLPFDEWLLRLNWVDLFASYETGLSKILRVVTLNKSMNLEISTAARKIDYEGLRQLLDKYHMTIDEEYLMRILLLCDGNPVLIDLVVNHLLGSSILSGSLTNYSVEVLKKMPEEMLLNIKDNFYAEMVEPIMFSMRPSGFLIAIMSLIPSLFTVHLYTYLMGISLSQAQEHLDTLAGSSLVKHDNNSDTYTLNEIVQKSIYNHFWSNEDYQQTKQAIAERAVNFYQTLIAELSIKMDEYQEELERTRQERDYDQQIVVIRSLELISTKSKLYDEQLKYCQNLSAQ